MTWWRRLVRRSQLDAQLDAELADHVERQTADLVRSGLPESEARRQAAAMFGSVESTREACRDTRGTRWLDDLAADTRYALRLLRRSPGFSAVAVLSLALGLGANIAVAALLDAVVLRTLPVSSPHDLVLLGERAPDRETFSWSRNQFDEFGASRALSGVCAFRPRIDFAVDGDAGVEIARGQLVSGNCFEVLGLRPFLGRLLTRDDDRTADADPAAVIGYGFWKRHLGGDPAAIGRTLRLKGRAFTIVGVTQPEFLSLEPGQAIDVTVPLAHAALLGGFRVSPDTRWLRLIGRVAPAVARESAAADLERLWQHSTARRLSRDARLEVLSGAQGLNELRTQFAAPLRIVAGGVGLLLLVTCANLASLLLARAHARDVELRMRSALGAARGRLVRQLVTESCVLSALGGVAGTVLAVWGAQTIVVLLSRGRVPVALPPLVDGRLIGFALVLTALTALTFGIWPALWATRRTSPATDGMRSTRRSRGAAAALIAGQTCLSATLLAVAVLFSRSLGNLHSVDVGSVDARHVLIATLHPGLAGVDRAQVRPLYRALWTRLSASSDVRSVSMAMDLPLGGVSYTAGVSAPSVNRKDDQVNFNFVGPRFFETMGIPILSGRDLRLEDDERSPPVAVVGSALASEFFPHGTAIGEHLDLGDVVVEIVGVAADVPYTSLRAPRERMVYRPYLQQTSGSFGVVFVVRTDLPTSASAARIRGAVREIAPAIPVAAIDTLEARVDGSISGERLLAAISGFFGVMSLLLVGVGVYGTLAYAIAQRAREMGIRQALGAGPSNIVRLVLRGALTPVAAGLAIGLPLALAAARTARAELFGITAAAPSVYVSTVIVLLGAALTAAAVPIRRALRADPLAALRDP